MRVLVLSVCGGTLGTGGCCERARVVPVRRTPDVVACRALSPPDVAVTRMAAEVVRREGTEVARDEAGTRDAGDWAGEVDTFVRR